MTFFFRLLSFLIPPRAAERVVERLTLDELRALKKGGTLPYHDPRVKALIWELKYHKSAKALAFASALLAEEIVGILGEEILEQPLLIPLPMHQHRRRIRGFNHTELLCRALLEVLPERAVEYAPRLMRRHKETPQQVTLPAAARLTNVEGAFSMNEDVDIDVIGRTCILIDDVKTTGATLADASKVLQRAGARTVEQVVLAH